MATSWKSQQGNGEYSLQFETDNKEKYKLVEKAAQMAVDGKTRADVVEVKHGEWKSGTLGGHHGWYCSVCGSGYQGVEAQWIAKSHDYCGKCGAKMDGKDNNVPANGRSDT